MSLTGPPPRLTRCPGLMSPAGSLSFPHIASAPRSSGKAQKRRCVPSPSSQEAPVRSPRARGAAEGSERCPCRLAIPNACPVRNHSRLRVPHAILSEPEAQGPNAR